ncbi:MAG: HPP family protein [Planctomycetota bacterium]|nr:MAG: HPP family protein [Planctomycetota bacterium]
MPRQANNSAATTITAKFKKLWKYYILQSLLAAAALLVLVLILGKEKIVIISTMGATSFIVFAMPKAASAQTRNVIGGHLVGLACGAIFYFTALPYFLEYPFAVAVAIFLMVALDVEHPPAAGTALAVVINEVSRDAFITIMVSTVVLSQCRYYLRNYLKDLV